MNENCRSPKSVPKIRREPSPQYVSDRLRRARNCSNERRENSTNRSFEIIRSTDSIQVSPRCTVESDRYARNHSRRTRMGESTYSNHLPERVLKLVVTPCNKEYGTSQKFCDDLNIIGVYMKVLEELKQEVNSLEGSNLNVPRGKSPISGFIDECFRRTNSRSSIIEIQLPGYVRTLAVECVEIIERVILQQNEIISELNDDSKLSTKKKIKTLLLNVILGIEHELILSEKILEIVDTDLHQSSFQFIYCLLKHFVEKIAVHLKTSGESNFGLSQTLVESSFVSKVVSRTGISNCKIDEYSNRLDNLLKQWSGTGDTCSKIESSHQVVIDCYHCLSEKKERDLLLKTVSRFTEEIRRKLIECHGGEKSARVTKNNVTEKIAEASKIEEPSTNDTGCSTDMSTYYSWTVTGSNRPRLNDSRNLSQYSNQAETNSSPNRNSYQDGRNTRNLSPPLARSSNKGSIYPSNGRNYFSKPQSGAVSNSRGKPPSIVDNSIHHGKYPPILDDPERFRDKSPTKTEGNYRHKSPNTRGRNANKLISAPPIEDRNRNYRGSSPSMTSSVNGSNDHTKPPRPLIDDSLVNYKSRSKAERNHQTKLPYVAAKEENKLVTAPCVPNNVNHRNMDPIMTDDNIYHGNSAVSEELRRSNGMNYPRPHPPTAADKYYRNAPPQIPNVRTMPPQLTLKPFPKLQLPTFDPCRTTNSRCYCNVPRCISQVPSSQGCNLFSQGKTCLIICEDKPKPPYFDRYPGFNGAGFYGNGYDYSFPPQMVNTFPVSTQPKNEKKDKKSKNEERKKSTSKSVSSKARASESPIEDGKSVINISPTSDAQERESKSKMDISKNEQPPSKDVENQSREPRGESSFGDTRSAKMQSQTNVAKPSISTTKLPPDASQKSDNPNPAAEGSKSRVTVQEGSSSSKQPDADKTQEDSHCICCKCKSNKDNVDSAAMFLNPCYCNSQESKGSRPIFQFFANPIPCNCQHKSGVQSSRSQLSQDQKRDTQDQKRDTQDQKRDMQDQKRDSQDAGTQTGKKPTPCDSADQMTPAQSGHENAPCILSSESCTCTVSRSSSRNKRDPESNQPGKSKSDMNCNCPQDIEEVFQNFDDKYSKCVQEIKVLIREGYLHRYNGSDESFTVTREITIVPSKTKSAEGKKPEGNKPEGNKPKDAPQHHLEFREDQDKIHSEDSYKSPKSHDKPQTHTSTDLRSDIEELKRLIKDSRFGHCPCCKCCKCEKEGKVSEECSKPRDLNEQGKNRSDPSLAQSQPASKPAEEEEKNPATLPPAEYFDKMVDPKGATRAKDEPGKPQAEASSVSGKKPTGKSSKGNEKEPSIKSINERPGAIPKDDKSDHSSIRFDVPKKTSSKETVGTGKEPTERSKTKEESAEYQSEPFSGQSTTKRDQEIKDTNNIPPEGSKIIHISPSYIDPEGLPTAVKELIVTETVSHQESGSKVDSKKQGERQSQDQAKPQRLSNDESSQQGQRQSSISSKSQTSSSKKNSKQDGGKDGSKVSPSADPKNRKAKHSGKSLGGTSDEKIKSTENLQGELKAGGGLQPSNLDQSNQPKSGGGQEVGEKTEDNTIVLSPRTEDGTAGPLTTARGTKVSIADGKVIIEVPLDSTNDEPGEREESKKTTNLVEGPSLEAESEYAGVKQGSKEKPETKTEERKLNNGLDEKKKSEAKVQNHSEIESTRPKPPQGRKIEKPRSGLESEQSAGAEDKKKKSLVYDDAAEKQRKMSLERQALDESRDQVFSAKRGDNAGSARSGDEDAGRSWSPFEGVFGSKKERGTSKTTVDDSGSDVFQAPDGDEDTTESAASSSTVVDDCKDLFDSRPCTFYSDESGISSITEVIKATETELYVMIIESQPPLIQSHDRHDEIISLLLSENNVSDFSGNSDLGNRPTSKTSDSDSQQISSPDRSHGRTSQNGREKQSCFPVELITLRTSDESALLDSDNGSSEVVGSNSSNEQPLSLERATSSSLHIINKVMKERKIASSSKEGKDSRRSSSVRKRADKKKVHYTKIPKRTHDKMTRSRESVNTVEELDFSDNVKNQEVQVTKWNCKVQTAGPRKFNRTDIPREMEDKLAKYLGLERTVEQMDLKMQTVKDEKSTSLKETSEQKELKRSSEKKLRNTREK